MQHGFGFCRLLRMDVGVAHHFLLRQQWLGRRFPGAVCLD
uniref:Uncharacterized protein n=1 Tax=Zea mays TaxID=4577 RepID=C4J8N6_MAIZE|nr:unknown [Zea mays]